jgi:uncharacterized protein (DUF58 family)
MTVLTARLREIVDFVRTRLPALGWVTGLGWQVVGTVLLCALLGLTFDWVELNLLAITFSVVIAASFAFTVGRTSLRVSLHPDRKRMVVGGPAQCRVEVHIVNTGSRRVWPLDVEVVVGEETSYSRIPGLAPHGEHRMGDIVIHPVRRGVVVVGPATGVRGDPIGMLRAGVRWPERSEVFIHPRTVPLESLATGLLRDLEGNPTADLSSSDLAFHTLREYAPGDDYRHIHWKSTAKLNTGTQQRFLVRQYLDTRRASLMLVVDDDMAVYRDENEYEVAVSVGASIAVRAMEDEIETTVVTGVQPVRVPGVNPALDAFARAVPGQSGLAESCGRAARATPEGTVAVLVTGGNAAFRQLHLATARFAPEVRKVVVRVEPAVPAGISAGSGLTILSVRGLADLPMVLSGWSAS